MPGSIQVIPRRSGLSHWVRRDVKEKQGTAGHAGDVRWSIEAIALTNASARDFAAPSLTHRVSAITSTDHPSRRPIQHHGRRLGFLEQGLGDALDLFLGLSEFLLGRGALCQ